MAATGVPGASTFGPGGANLIGAQVNPTTDTRLAATQTATDAASRALTTAPDRGQIAGSTYDALVARGEPAYQAQLRQVGQRAAALGRVGAGMTTNELTDVSTQRSRDLDLSRRELANTAAGATMGDRLSTLNAMSGLEGQQAGQGAANRAEVRGERGYQYSLSQDAQNAAIQQGLTEDAGLAADRAYGMDKAKMLTNAGYANSPAATLLDSATGAQSAGQDAFNAAAGMAGQRAQAPAPTGTGIVPAPTAARPTPAALPPLPQPPPADNQLPTLDPYTGLPSNAFLPLPPLPPTTVAPIDIRTLGQPTPARVAQARR